MINSVVFSMWFEAKNAKTQNQFAKQGHLTGRISCFSYRFHYLLKETF